MLEENGIAFEYRDYRKQPLSETEIRAVLKKLRLGPREVLRAKDRAYADSGLTAEASDDQLIRAMAAHPTLLQRPIGVAGRRAVLGRPVENLRELT